MYPSVPWAFHIAAALGSAFSAAGLAGEAIRGFATVCLAILLAVSLIVSVLVVVLPRALYAFAGSKIEPLAEFTGRATAEAIVLDVGEDKRLEWPLSSLRIHASDDALVVVSNKETGIISLARELFDSEEEWIAVRDRILEAVVR
jgi:hypothetical protein